MNAQSTKVNVEYGTVETGSGIGKAKRVTWSDGTVEVRVFAQARAAKARTSDRKATATQAATFTV